MIKKYLKTTGGIFAIVLLSGCAATNTLIQHGSLQTSTKMSSTIFLPPQATQNKVIYVQVKNTSDQNMDIQTLLTQDLQAKGYTIASDVNQADQVLQVNILQVGETTASNIGSMLSDGFGGAVAGAALGAGVSSNALAGGAAGGIIGGLTTTVANSLVKDVVYSVTTDVQISVKLPEGVKATQNVQSALQQGTGTVSSTTYSTQTNMQQYQTRVISWADQVNLDFEDAAPVLEKNLAQSIANIF